MKEGSFCYKRTCLFSIQNYRKEKKQKLCCVLPSSLLLKDAEVLILHEIQSFVITVTIFILIACQKNNIYCVFGVDIVYSPLCIEKQIHNCTAINLSLSYFY